MGIQLDHAALASAAGALDARADEMASRRAAIEASVESLRATWRGDAAARFGVLWEEWRSSADTVIEALSRDVSAMRFADDELRDTDHGAGESHARLQRRLG